MTNTEIILTIVLGLTGSAFVAAVPVIVEFIAWHVTDFANNLVNDIKDFVYNLKHAC